MTEGDFNKLICQATGAKAIGQTETIQELWSGYGHILRLELQGAAVASVIVKRIRFGNAGSHPRGWNTAISHQRKLRSYKVETHWYQHWSQQCTPACRIPTCLAVVQQQGETLIILEDLNASGFPGRRTSLGIKGIKACLAWLANFHAIYLNNKPDGLWETGTYWHLNTRPDELEALDDLALKQAALAIDRKLAQSPFLTFVHGDAKLANFCFGSDEGTVAAVDFQYIGAGCGMKDVAYFIGSCMNEADCEQYEELLLNHYFDELRKASTKHQPKIDADLLENDWRDLYPFAWTDFHRFLKGWSPGHWKINSYSERMSKQTLTLINHQEFL